jgi:hypothetical protein
MMQKLVNTHILNQEGTQTQSAQEDFNEKMDLSAEGKNHKRKAGEHDQGSTCETKCLR